AYGTRPRAWAFYSRSGVGELLARRPGHGRRPREMSGIVVTFLALGGFALLLLILSLIGGGHLHLGHVHVGHIHLGHLHLGPVHAGHHGGGELSLPVISGFLGAFGFAGAIAGQEIKFNARADQPLARGTRIFVIEVPSPTSVLVEPSPSVQ